MEDLESGIRHNGSLANEEGSCLDDSGTKLLEMVMDTIIND